MKYGIKEGLKDGFPIVIGYFPIAMTFGILAKGAGITLMESLAFSICVYAGASQFIAVNMIALSVGVGEIILATLLINFRHFFMSASLANKLDNVSTLSKPFLSFWVTDEVFSVASFAKGEISPKYLGAMELIAYLSWCSGTGAGYILGGILPSILQKSMGIGLYAMFVALLVPEIKKSPKALVLALSSGGLNTLLRLVFSMPQGWSIVVTIIVVSLVGVHLYANDTDEKEEEVSYE